MSAKKGHALDRLALRAEREREKERIYALITLHIIWRADREKKNRNCFPFLRPARTTQSSFIYLFAGVCSLSLSLSYITVRGSRAPEITSEALLTLVPLSPGGPEGHTV